MWRAEMFIIFKYCYLIYSNSIQCSLLLLVPHVAQNKDLFNDYSYWLKVRFLGRMNECLKPVIID